MARRKSFDVVSFIAASQVATLGGASEFSPSDVSGLFAWFDFSDITTLYQDAAKTTAVSADDHLIGACADKSGGGRDLTQGTAGARPTYKANIQNGLSISRYLPANDTHFDSGFSLPAVTYLFVVVKLSLTNTYQHVFDGREANDDGIRALFMTAPATDELQFSVDAVDINTGSGDTTTFHLYSCLFNGSRAYLRKDATAINDSAATLGGVSSNLVVGQAYGGSQDLNGDIGEIIIYNTAISDADRNSVEAFLKSKWGIT